MISNLRVAWSSGALSLLAFFATPFAANADATYNVQLDTSSLVAPGAFSLNFQFGSGSEFDLDNTVTLSNFNFGGGSAMGTASLSGYALGDLTSGITLQDSAPSATLTEFLQDFTPGSSLSFDISFSENLSLDGNSDLFTFSILDSGVNIWTASPSGTDAFLELTIGAPASSLATFASGDGSISAPMATAIPEPSTYGLCLGVLLGAVVAVRRLRSRCR
ncbi:MAG TPA: NF038129 family PEP-CTERM protein [Opitutaceae bacterium]|nr:NF038129 family PEP-CTERM protein [Opitutaceae bacterium]